jgi:hypothetical protein
MPISETIEEKDEEALKALKDIRLSYLDDKPGFKLHFTFDKNDFFEDGELTKTYYYQVSVSLITCLFSRGCVCGSWVEGEYIAGDGKRFARCQVAQLCWHLAPRWLGIGGKRTIRNAWCVGRSCERPQACGTDWLSVARR